MNDAETENDNDEVIDGKTAQLLCEEFAAVTGTDTACAQFYLQDRKWNLEQSVNAFFDARNSSSGVQFLDDGDEPEMVVKLETFAAAVVDVAEQSRRPSRMKIISWNVDGLDEVDLKLRTKNVCSIIKSELPDIIFLQEVVPSSLLWFIKYLPEYDHIAGNNTGYFTLTLWRQNSFLVVEEKEVVPFPTSSMGRNLTIVKIRFADVPLVLMNSHLESTKEHSGERLNQLRKGFKCMQKRSQAETVLFGGDLNLRDKELDDSGGIPAGINDLWILCGQRPECSYTWDTMRNDNKTFPGRFKPRLRFDRLYLRHGTPGRVTARHFGLIGLERLKPCRRFPSDHWGIIVHFDIV